ncbi:type II secretion system F family protein [Planctomicrobium sp. SH664]|uniref:type II secretion system F family protein n=1 Tax=Planctomicrobium sp. SH664 TaxID=3448125 RepID=UPI003F5C5BB0
MSARPLKNEDLVLLSQELGSMIRAGVPLDLGLSMAARATRGRLSRLLDRLQQRLLQGESLDVAIQAEQGLPPVYRAVVVAALRSSQPNQLLNQLAQMTQNLNWMQRRMGMQMIYPAAVVIVAMLLGGFMLEACLDRLVDFYKNLRIPLTPWLEWLSRQRSVILPLMGLIVGSCCLFVLQFFWPTLRAIWRLPGTGPLFRELEASRLSSVAALLIRSGIPLPESLRLSAAAVESKAWQKDLHSLALAIEQGQPLSAALLHQRSLPPFLQWLMLAGERDSQLDEALQQSATFHRERAMRRANLLQRVWPTLLILFVGGCLTFFYSMTLILPLQQLWTDLALTPR